MDRQVRKLNTQKDESDNGSEVGSENDSENGNDLTNARNAPVGSGGSGAMNCDSDSITPIETKKCDNCSTTASGQFHHTGKGTFCRACYSYWRRTGLMRNINLARHNDSTKPSSLAGKRKPPRGMYINIDDLLSIAKKPGQGDALLKVLDEEVNNIKRQVQNNKQLISQLKNKTSSGVDSFRPAEVKNHFFSIHCTHCELFLFHFEMLPSFARPASGTAALHALRTLIFYFGMFGFPILIACPLPSFLNCPPNHQHLH